jgi:putative SOS response-associated peptidase YedK
LVAPLHPKAMPVILQREDYDRWLDGEAADACSLAQPFPSQLMRVA